MQTHIIQNGVVTNTILASVQEAEAAFPDSVCIDASLGGSIGDRYVDGQFVRPEPPAPEIPQTVTMRQCRIALLDAGLLESVQSSIATMPGTEGERARIDWEYAQEVRRDWPLIAYMAADLGLTDEQVDAMFVAASAI